MATRVTNLTFIITTSQTTKKANMDKTISGDRLGINLENPFFSKNSLRDSRGKQQLFENYLLMTLRDQLHCQMIRIVLILTI